MALGQRLFLRHALHGGGVVAVIAIFAIVLLIRFWPVIISWWEGRR